MVIVVSVLDFRGLHTFGVFSAGDFGFFIYYYCFFFFLGGGGIASRRCKWFGVFTIPIGPGVGFE